MTVGERIYYCRLENKLTQRELGEKVGIDSATIGKYERGALNPKLPTVQKIAEALGVSWADLMPEELLDAGQTARTGGPALTQAEADLIARFRSLNAAGQQEAAKRLAELGMIPQYQKN